MYLCGLAECLKRMKGDNDDCMLSRVISVAFNADQLEDKY